MMGEQQATTEALKSHTPTVSVVMAVYNGARYLRHAVDSILDQSLPDLEFVIVDDGSTDDTASILDSICDPRLVRVDNGRNMGLTRSLNRGITASTGCYVARQDADDWSLPERLARQVAYLEAHLDVGLVGTGSRWIDGQGGFVRDWQPQTDPADIQQRMLSAMPFLHGTLLFRRSCLADVGGYDERLPVAQDCDLLLRIAERWEVSNLPDVLYVHRRHEDTVTARRAAEQQACLQRARQAAIERRLSFGLGRLRLTRTPIPTWVRSAERRWLARRYVWWSAAARSASLQLALQFLLFAFMLDPALPEGWAYVRDVLVRKVTAQSAERCASS
jgi:glycosyltransferase involved in cell wall biosynthesis